MVLFLELIDDLVDRCSIRYLVLTDNCWRKRSDLANLGTRSTSHKVLLSSLSHDKAHAPYPGIGLILPVLSVGHTVRWWPFIHLILHLLQVLHVCLHVGLLLLTCLLVRTLSSKYAPIVNAIWNHRKVSLGLTSAKSFVSIGLHARMTFTLVDYLAEDQRAYCVRTSILYIFNLDWLVTCLRNWCYSIHILWKTKDFLFKGLSLLGLVRVLWVGIAYVNDASQLDRGSRWVHSLARWCRRWGHRVMRMITWVTTKHLEGLILRGMEQIWICSHVVHPNGWLLHLLLCQDLTTLASPLRWICVLPLLLLLLGLLLLLSLFLFDNILQESMSGVSCNRHIPILFEFRVIALCFLWNAVSEKSTRKALILIFYGKHLVEAAKIIKLVDSALINLSCKFFSSHLVPEKCWLLMHLFEFTVTNDAV